MVLSPRFGVNVYDIAVWELSTLNDLPKMTFRNRTGQVFATFVGEDAIAANQALLTFIERGPAHKWGQKP